MRTSIKTRSPIVKMTLASLCLTGLAVGTAGAITPTTDNFGSGPNAFSIEFAAVGNPGNGNEVNNPFPNSGDGGTAYGGVSYDYRMSVTEVSRDWLAKAGTPGGNPLLGSDLPAASITWYQAAAFVNYLNTSTGHSAAYNLDVGATTLTLWSSGDAWQLGGENLYRNANAYYFLPSEDEWYKAAYHQNDGVTANYWDYATGSNGVPTAVAGGTGAGTAVYDEQAGPANVTLAGGLSAYGTMGQSGNVSEWQESAFVGPNDVSDESRTIRAGNWGGPEIGLRSSVRNSFAPASSNPTLGFRVASVPEPSSAMLMLGSGLVFLARRRRGSSL